MDHLSLTDRFSFNTQDYLLRTTDDADAGQIVLQLFRQGDIIHSSQAYYNGFLSEPQRKELALQEHQSKKHELTKLFQLYSQRLQSGFETSSRYLLAGGFLKYGMTHEAVELLYEVVQIQPAHQLAYTMLGQAYLKINEYKRAHEQFQYAITINENYADLYFNLGFCECQLHRCEPAVQAFSQAIKINPHYGEAYFYLGMALLLNVMLGQEYDLTISLAERAQKIFERARAILPVLRGAAFDQGLQLLQQEKFEGAFDAFAPLTDGISGSKPEVINYLFHLLVLHEPEKIRLEEVWQEIKRLEKLQQGFPEYPDVEHELGFAYAVLGLTVSDKSSWYFERALAKNPAYQKAYTGLKLVKNDQRGFLHVLHTILSV